MLGPRVAESLHPCHGFRYGACGEFARGRKKCLADWRIPDPLPKHPNMNPPHACKPDDGPDFWAASDQLMMFLTVNGFSAEQSAALLTSMAAQIAAAANICPHELTEILYNSFSMVGGEVEFTG